MFDFEELDFINMDEINKLLAEFNTETPLIRKTPDMIEKNPNVVERSKELIEFTWLHDLYITPLSEFAKRVCVKLGIPFSEIPSFSNASIMGRMSKLRDFLLSKGCTLDTVFKLIPKNTSEIALLVEAKKCGFDLGFKGISDLTNDNRLERAKNFILASAKNNSTNDNIVYDGKNL